MILVRPETSPDDVGGMLSSRGVLTQHGGATSHAAVVARGNNLPCVVGCEEVSINTERRRFTVNGRTINEGDTISIDGTTGEVFAGAIPTIDPDFIVRSNWPPCSSGPMRSAGWASIPMPITRVTPAVPESWALRASACAAPSTCSSKRGVVPSSWA